VFDRAEYNRKYYLEHPEKYLSDNKKAYKREWYLKNREHVLAKRLELRASEGYAAYQHQVWERRKANPIRLAKKYEGNVLKAKEYREKIYDILGHICCKCAFSDKRALQIDHINGGGHDHRIATGWGNRAYYKSIVEDSQIKEKFQILCANCNWIKKFENREI
jgi:hypothetical protein